MSKSSLDDMIEKTKEIVSEDPATVASSVILSWVALYQDLCKIWHALDYSDSCDEETQTTMGMAIQALLGVAPEARSLLEFPEIASSTDISLDDFDLFEADLRDLFDQVTNPHTEEAQNQIAAALGL